MSIEFVDTNILLYAHDKTSAGRRDGLGEIFNGGSSASLRPFG